MNETELVKKALEELKKEGIEEPIQYPNKGKEPLKAFDLIMKLTEIQRDKEDKEYAELLRNGNGNGDDQK